MCIPEEMKRFAKLISGCVAGSSASNEIDGGRSDLCLDNEQ